MFWDSASFRLRGNILVIRVSKGIISCQPIGNFVLQHGIFAYFTNHNLL